MGTRKVNFKDYPGCSLSEIYDHRTHTTLVGEFKSIGREPIWWSEHFPDGDCRTHTVLVKKYEPKQENKLKELTLKDLDDGVIIVMPNGIKYKACREKWELTEDTFFPRHHELRVSLKGHNFRKPTAQPKTEEENIMKKEFTKADLRSGHKVKCRNGNIYTVFLNSSEGGKDVLSRDSGWAAWSYLDRIQDDLTSKDGRDLDIIEVSANPVYALTTDRRYTHIWKREEKTPEQLAYEALQAQIAEEEARHADSIKALREQAEKLKPKNTP